MNKQENYSVEKEFRSSQTYQILSGAGTAGQQIARGLSRAAEELDKAAGEIGGAAKTAVNRANSPSPGSRPGAQGNRAAAAAARASGQTGGVRYTGGQGSPVRRPDQNPAVTRVPPPQMKTVRRPSRAKFYIAGAAALLYAANLPLYQPVHYLLFGLVVAGAFALANKLFKGREEIVPAETPAAQPAKKPKAGEKPKAEEKTSTTGDPEVDKIISEGSQYLKKLRAANDAIPEETLSEDIDRMERASADIFRFIAEHPEKAPQIRKFMNYYLPTTLKLLNTYQRLSAQSAKGENITSTMFNIAGMMHTVADAFEKQLDGLFTDEAMDVSADISVFETLLNQEGLVEEKAVRRTKQNRVEKQ